MPRRMRDAEQCWLDLEQVGPMAKLVELRLWFGAETSPAGTTRVRSIVVAADLGVEVERVEAAIDQLVDAKLVRRYPGGWLWMGARWLAENASGPAFRDAARRAVRGAPEALRVAVTRALDAHEEKTTARASEKTHTRHAPDRKVTHEQDVSGSDPTTDHGSDGGSDSARGPVPGEKEPLNRVPSLSASASEITGPAPPGSAGGRPAPGATIHELPMTPSSSLPEPAPVRLFENVESPHIRSMLERAAQASARRAASRGRDPSSADGSAPPPSDVIPDVALGGVGRDTRREATA